MQDDRIRAELSFYLDFLLLDLSIISVDYRRMRFPRFTLLSNQDLALERVV